MKSVERIVIDPDICHGKPTIRGTRIMVSNVLGLLANGESIDQVLEYYPDLDEADVKAAISYAAAFIDDEIVLTPSAI